MTRSVTYISISTFYDRQQNDHQACRLLHKATGAYLCPEQLAILFFFRSKAVTQAVPRSLSEGVPERIYCVLPSIQSVSCDS